MSDNLKGLKKPRTVTFRGVTYPSINSLARWAKEHGYNVGFPTIRLALNLGRDLEDVFAGKKFEKRFNKPPIIYKGVSYPTAIALYRALYKKRKRVYLCSAAFCVRLKRNGVEDAVDGLLHKHITNASISRRLGVQNNLVHVRIKNGWNPSRARHEKCGAWRTKGKKHE